MTDWRLLKPAKGKEAFSGYLMKILDGCYSITSRWKAGRVVLQGSSMSGISLALPKGGAGVENLYVDHYVREVI
jgi:hypothetical protein